jgi:hypothetical protein
MKRLSYLASALFLFASLGVTSRASAQAARVFLSGTGDDTADCSNAATPCRSLQGAINQAAVGAEVIVLTSGGYGGATINKSITVNAPAGVVAFVGRTITVTLAAADVVILRGLSMNGATFQDPVGINFTAGGTLILENSIIAGFGGSGMNLSGPASNLIVNNCEIRRNHGQGIFGSSASTPINVTIENSRFEQNYLDGIQFRDHVRATIRGSVFAAHHLNNTSSGVKIEEYATDSPTTVSIEGCVITNNDYGVGVYAAANTSPLIRVSGSMITNHNIAVLVAGPGTGSIVSYGNNRLGGNNNATFSGTIAQQ